MSEIATDLTVCSSEISIRINFNTHTHKRGRTRKEWYEANPLIGLPKCTIFRAVLSRFAQVRLIVLFLGKNAYSRTYSTGKCA